MLPLNTAQKLLIALGADPIVTIEHETGIGALRLLLITLAITPLRQLTGVEATQRWQVALNDTSADTAIY